MARWLLTLTLLLLLAVPGPVAAQETPKEAGFKEEGPWKISAEEMNYDEQKEVLEAHGRVVIKQDSDRIIAEHARFERRTKNLEAWGRVIWYHGADVLQAERVKLNQDTGLGKAYNGRLFFSGNHFHIFGREIEKVSDKTYYVRECTLTSCDSVTPDWIVKAYSMRVTQEGYGHLFAPRFHAGPVPVFFLPYTFFPAKSKRQSGFLMPSVIQSARDGFVFELPYYWAWADWGETTFHWHHTERGEGMGAELRFKLGADRDMGLFYYDYLDDDQAEELYRSGDLRTDLKRRYWLRGMFRSDKSLPYKIGMTMTLDWPSDPDFIEDFSYWTTGLPKINPDFLQYFGQNLQDATETVRTNTLQLRRNFSGSSARLDMLYYHDPTPREPDEVRENLNALPRFTYNYADKAIGETDLYYNYSFQAQRLWRDPGEWGHMGDLRTKFYGVFDLGPYLNAQPFVMGRATWWDIVEDPENPVSTLENPNLWRDRYYFQTGMDLSTSLFKIYDVDDTEWRKIKHQVEPHLGFVYTPPHYDPAPTSYSGHVGPVENFTYGFTTTLTAKRETGLAEVLEMEEEIWRRRYLGHLATWGMGDEKYEGLSDDDLRADFQRQLRLSRLKSEPNYAYDEFLRLEVNQSFNLRETKIPKPEGAVRRPFSAVTSEFWFNPTRRIRTRGEVDYDPNYGKMTNLALHLNMSDRRGDYIGVHYRRQWNIDEDRQSVAQINSNAGLKLWGGLSTMGEIIYNLETSETIRRTVGLNWDRQCWGIGTYYTRTRDDERIAIVFSLLGIGQIYRYERSFINQNEGGF